MKLKKYTSGFTLIELLVVISIISLLSSIILAAVSNARSQATVTAGLAFADHNLQVYGADAILSYNFDYTSGGKILDTTGNGRNLNPIGGAFALSASTPNPKGMSFTSGTAVFGSSTIASTISSPNYTISAWVYLTSLTCAAGACVIAAAEGSNTMPLGIYIDASANVNCYSDTVGNSAVFSGIQTGKWYHIACAANSTNGQVAGYLNGKIMNTSQGTYNPLNIAVTSFYVGNEQQYGPYPGITGYIDDVALYTHAINGNN